MLFLTLRNLWMFIMKKRGGITRWLDTSPAWIFNIYAIITSFTVYFCMYSFRKPFSAATYEGLEVWGLDLKHTFIISQVLGYALSKFVGIKICSETARNRRLFMLIGLIIAAEIALLLFASLPTSLKIAAIFLNGFPLGMIWGMCVSYLEGRRASELLLAGLSCSFIISSGVVKDVGWMFIETYGIDQFWMPFYVGLLFLPLFILSSWMLDQIPDPTEADVQERVQRLPMYSEERWAFLKRFWPGLIMLLIAYFFLTAFRDYRDNFQVDILTQLDANTALSITEVPVAFVVMGALALLSLIRDNRMGLIGAYVIMSAGLIMLGVSTYLLERGLIDPVLWMFLIGSGGYLAYVPYGSVLFDRTVAATRVVSTAVFTIYVADFLGYLGSISVMVYKMVASPEVSRLEFFISFTYFMCFVGTILLIASCFYFLKHSKPVLEEEQLLPQEAAKNA